MKMQPSDSFQIYNASAGSGKTFTLVKEYLKIILQATNIFKFQQILAMTFTNKASAEMKTRVLENLQDFSEGKTNDMQKALSKETTLSKEDIQKKSQKIVTAILKNYSGFNITTIDSFTYSVVKTFAYDLKIPMNFEVEMDAQKLLHEAIDVTISKIGINKDLTQLLIDFSLQKLHEDKSWDITYELKNYANILLKENDAQQIKKLTKKSITDFVTLKNKLYKEVQKLERQMAALGEQGIACILENNLEAKDFYRTMLPNHLMHLQSNYKKAKFFDQSRLRERLEEGTFYAKSKPNHIKQHIEAIMPALLDIYAASEKTYQRLVLYKVALESIVPLAVLNHIQKELNTLKNEQNIRLNAEFNRLIHDTIKDEPAPFIYERLGEKYRHYFIDEMQDTSVLQWQNLHKLIENALETEDLNQQTGTLLLVGDAKQSIYRWRGSKPEQFIDLTKDNNPFQIPKNLKNLETNYRSFSEIIDFNNSFFEHLGNLLQRESYQELYIKTARQRINNKTGGYVEISFLEKDEELDKSLLYPEKVYQIIQSLDSNFKKSEVCILVRKNADGVTVANYLSEKGIAIISSETLLLERNANIDFIINILHILNNEQEKDARVNALLFLHDFLSLKEEKHTFLESFIHLQNTAFFKALQTYDCYFSENEFFQLSFYESIEYLLRSFHLTKKPDAYLQYFLDFVLEFQQKNEQTLPSFLDYWELKKSKASIVVPEMDHAVRIMSIHKSKGLEFPVVILPYNSEIYRQKSPKVWFDVTAYPIFEGFETLLLNFKADLKYASDYAQHLDNQQREQLELDNYNLLYVALTRAVEQLYVVTEKKKFDAEKLSTFADLFMHYLQTIGEWEEEKKTYCFGNSKRVVTTTPTSKHRTTKTQAQFISSNWKNHQINVVTNTSALWDTKQGEAIAFGNVTHKILSEIQTKKDIEAALKKYYFEGKIASQELDYIKDQVTKVVTHPKLQAYFSKDVTVWNERELLSDQKEIHIPDRMVQLQDNTIAILDYKTGAAEKKHRHQVERYSEVLQQMNYKVSAKILIYLNKEAITIDQF